MPIHRAVFHAPGHFHAARTLRAPNPRLAPDIHVYASPGLERDAFVHLVESFHRRSDYPTQWTIHLHEGEQLLERLIQDGQGDLVVLAGRNNTKLATMARLTHAGLHVLADKPATGDGYHDHPAYHPDATHPPGRTHAGGVWGIRLTGYHRTGDRYRLGVSPLQNGQRAAVAAPGVVLRYDHSR